MFIFDLSAKVGSSLSVILDTGFILVFFICTIWAAFVGIYLFCFVLWSPALASTL